MRSTELLEKMRNLPTTIEPGEDYNSRLFDALVAVRDDLKVWEE